MPKKKPPTPAEDTPSQPDLLTAPDAPAAFTPPASLPLPPSMPAIDGPVPDKKKLGSRYSILPEEVIIVGLDTPEDERHPLHDPRVRLPVDEMDVQDVMANCRNGGPGLLQDPVVVADAAGHLLVIDGRQRVRWMREVNRRLARAGQEPRRIGVTFRGALADVKGLAGIGVSANAHRIDDDPITRSEKLRHYLAVLGDDPYAPSIDSLEEAAVRFRVKSATSLRLWLNLLKLCAPVQDHVRSGRLTMRAVLPLCDLPTAEQMEAAQRLLESGLSGDAAIEMTRQARDAHRAGKADEGASDEEDDAPSKKKKPAKEKEAPSRGVSTSIAKKMLVLALADREEGAGAGTSLTTEQIALWRALVGEVALTKVKGLSELHNRVLSGEKP